MPHSICAPWPLPTGPNEYKSLVSDRIRAEDTVGQLPGTGPCVGSGARVDAA